MYSIYNKHTSMAGDKLTKPEVDARVDKCMELRFQANDPILFREWIKYCHKTYGDKSEQQYSGYWQMAKDRYDEGWKAKLNKMLDPAMNELFALLADEDPKIKQRAIDQIVKYTGNDIQKIEAKIEGNITLNWGNDLGNEQE
jgi:hypothetical protein